MASSNVKCGPRVRKQWERRRAPVTVRMTPVRKVGVSVVNVVEGFNGSDWAREEEGRRKWRRGRASRGGQDPLSAKRTEPSRNAQDHIRIYCKLEI